MCNSFVIRYIYNCVISCVYGLPLGEHARVQHDRTCLLSGALSPFIFLTSPGIFDRQVI